MPLLIYQTLCLLITDRKSHRKTKIESYLCPEGSKIGRQNPKIALRTYFRRPRTQVACNFRFCERFFISDDRKSIWYIIFRILCAVLPVFMKYGTAPKRAVGQKTDVVFGFRMKKHISLKLVFRFLRPELNFTVKLNFFF